MKALRSAATRFLPVLLLSCSALVLAPVKVLAQDDSAFLACGQLTDRGDRIACLEDALEEATPAQAAEPASVAPASPAPASPTVTATPPAVAPQPAASPPQAAPPQQATAPAAEERDDPSILERLRNFGRGGESATISTDLEGQDQLHDTITALEQHGSFWIVTLSSGQIWEQDYPRALNLRVGDAVTIYRAGFGNGYRLSTDRVSGFIRVKRVR